MRSLYRESGHGQSRFRRAVCTLWRVVQAAACLVFSQEVTDIKPFRLAWPFRIPFRPIAERRTELGRRFPAINAYCLLTSVSSLVPISKQWPTRRNLFSSTFLGCCLCKGCSRRVFCGERQPSVRFGSIPSLTALRDSSLWTTLPAGDGARPRASHFFLHSAAFAGLPQAW